MQSEEPRWKGSSQRRMRGSAPVSYTHLDVYKRQNDEGENILTVVITDDGKGMGDKKIEESGPNAYRPVTGKEGLGMQIVRTLVASELNGSIRWEANEPKGTRVVITAVLV